MAATYTYIFDFPVEVFAVKRYICGKKIHTTTYLILGLSRYISNHPISILKVPTFLGDTFLSTSSIFLLVPFRFFHSLLSIPFKFLSNSFHFAPMSLLVLLIQGLPHVEGVLSVLPVDLFGVAGYM